MEWWLWCLALGAFSGFLAGMLGIGGGAVLVPLLVMLFSAQQFPAENIMHMALGTSMSVIIFTSISSLAAHHRRGSVHWNIVARITPGILLGTLAGTWLAKRIPSAGLAVFFALFIVYVATQMILGFKPKPSRDIPGMTPTSLIGAGIGAFSCLVAIGGGSLSIPFMLWCNVNMRHAIGTSAAIGFPIALGGAAGYVLAGFDAPGLPAHTLGFVHLPSLAGVAFASILTAPLGARMTYLLPIQRLRQIFACLLLFLALKMLWGILSAA